MKKFFALLLLAVGSCLAQDIPAQQIKPTEAHAFSGTAASNLEVNLASFGAKGDDATNNDMAIRAALAALPAGECLVIPHGIYRYSTPFNLPACIFGNNARLKYVGASTASCVTVGSDNYQLKQENLIVDGHGNCIYGVHYQNVRGGTVYELQVTNTTANGTGIFCDYCQGVTFIHPVVSGNVEPFTTIPQNGMVIGGSNANSDNYVINPQFEHVSGDGIEITNGINNTIAGGTSEGNAYGIQCLGGSSQNCNSNTLGDGTDLEVNSSWDIQIYGSNAFGNVLRGLKAYSPNSIDIDSANGKASENVLESSATGGILIGSNANLTQVRNVTIYGAGAIFTDNGSRTTVYNVYNRSIATLIANKEPQAMVLDGGVTLGGKVIFSGTANPTLGHTLVLLTRNTTGSVGAWTYVFSPPLSAAPNCVASNVTDNTAIWISTETPATLVVSGSPDKFFNVQCWE